MQTSTKIFSADSWIKTRKVFYLFLMFSFLFSSLNFVNFQTASAYSDPKPLGDSITRVYEAEGASLQHAVGRLDGDGWSAKVSLDRAGHMIYGPYTTDISPGLNRAVFRMQEDNNSVNNDAVLVIDMNDATTGSIVVSKVITRKQFQTANVYQDFTLDFDNTAGHSLEFRVWWTGVSNIKVDKITVYSISKVYEAEGLSLQHAIGRLDGDGWSANTVQDKAGHMIYGPYTKDIVLGKNRAVFRMLEDNNSANNDMVAVIDINDATTGSIVVSKVVTRKQFQAANVYQDFAVDFDNTAGHSLEFRVWWTGISYLKVDKITVDPKGANFASLWNHESYFGQDHINTKMGWDFQMHFVTTLTVGDTYYFYYIKKATPNHPGVGLATTKDGVNFTDQGMVLFPGGVGEMDNDYASFQGMWYENGTFYLTYEASPGIAGQDIALATSTDGKNFIKRGVILSNNSTGWESWNIGTPTIWKENGIWYLFYHGFDGNKVQIGFASGTDLFHLTKNTQNPVLKCPNTGYDSGTIGWRSMYKEGAYYYMVYEVCDAKPLGQGFDNSNFSWAISRSSDLINWEKGDLNPCVPAKYQFGNDGPSIVSLNGELWVYYRDRRDIDDHNYTKRARLMNEVNNNGYDRLWEAEGMFHNVGRQDGDGWSANLATDNAGTLIFGPYATNTPVGENQAIFKLMTDNNYANNDVLVRIDAYDASSGIILASREITRNMFKQMNHYEYFTLPYTLATAAKGHAIEYRCFWYKKAYIKADKVLLKYGDSNPHAGN